MSWVLGWWEGQSLAAPCVQHCSPLCRSGVQGHNTAAAASTGTLWENESHINHQKAFELLDKKYLSRKIN